MEKEKKHMDEAGGAERGDRKLFGYVFMGCLLAAFAGIITVCLSVIKSRREEAQDMEQILSTIYAYFSETTEEEYEEIARQIRQDLVLGKYYAGDKLDYLAYIPNTAQNCVLEEISGQNQVCLLDLNTGSVYQLDFMEEELGEEEGLSVSWGYDEISETGIQIVTDYKEEMKIAEIDSKRGIVSVQRMKKLFCEECIHKILEANENTPLPELILYNGEQEAFYPIINGESYQCGDYEVDIIYSESGYYELRVAS